MLLMELLKTLEKECILVDNHSGLFMVLVCYFSVAAGWTGLQHCAPGNALCGLHKEEPSLSCRSYN